MAAKPKLSPAQWTEVKERWEGDPRKGFPWIIEEMGLPVSAEALRLRSKSEGWAKGGSKVAEVKPVKPRGPSNNPSKSKLGKTHESKLGISHDEDIESEQEEARSVGRPTLFRDDHVEQAYKLCLLGATDAELADFFEVSEDTIYEWKKVRPEFSEALRRGKAEADAEVAASLYKRAIGYSHPDTHVSNYQGIITLTELTKHYPPETGAAFLWLKNRQPHKWKDKVEVKEDVNINVFPSKEVLDAIYQKVLGEAAQMESKLIGRRERLGIVIEAGQDVD